VNKKNNRNHDRDQKPFLKNQHSIFITQSDPDFCGKSICDFHFANWIATQKPVSVSQVRRNMKSDPDFHVKIDKRFSFCDRIPILITGPDPGSSSKIESWMFSTEQNKDFLHVLSS
jgi:hypothetical protein